MGSRDRPHREVKKKSKAPEAKPKLQPFLEVPQNVELIKSIPQKSGLGLRKKAAVIRF